MQGRDPRGDAGAAEGRDACGACGGWYDRLIVRAAKQAPKIGIAYAFQLVDELPSEPHDIRLTSVANCEDRADGITSRT